MPFGFNKNNSNSNDMDSNRAARIAELEQSEAVLRCQLLNIEDQLIKTKEDLNFSKEQNDDLAEQCGKLESCLERLNAEKSLLSNLKSENANLRRKLGEAEDESLKIAEKLAQITQKNADLEHQNSQLIRPSNLPLPDGQSLKDILDENERLKQECYSVGESCLALEDVKESLAERCSHLESEITSEACRHDELTLQISALNEEKLALEERAEELKLERNLHSSMQGKLIEQIEELQDHVARLKVELNEQKVKADSVDLLRESLSVVQKEKNDLQNKCLQQKDKIEQLQKEMEAVKHRLEANNLQLMQETNELAKKYRNSLEENASLKLRLQASEVDSKLNQVLRNELNVLLQSHNKQQTTIDQQEDDKLNDVQFSRLLDNLLQGVVEDVEDFKRDLLMKRVRGKNLQDLRDLIDDNNKIVSSVTHACEKSEFYRDAASKSSSRSNQLGKELEDLKNCHRDAAATQQERDDLQRKIGELERKLRDANLSLDGSATQIQKFVDRIMQLEDVEASLQQQLKAKRQECDNYLNSNNSFESKMHRMQAEHESAIADSNARSQSELKEAADRERALRTRLEEVEEQIRQLRASNQTTENSNSVICKQQQTQLDRLKAELEDERETLRTTKALFNAMQEQKALELEEATKKLTVEHERELERLRVHLRAEHDVTVVTGNMLDEAKAAKETEVNRLREEQGRIQDIGEKRREGLERELKETSDLLSTRDHELSSERASVEVDRTQRDGADQLKEKERIELCDTNRKLHHEIDQQLASRNMFWGQLQAIQTEYSKQQETLLQFSSQFINSMFDQFSEEQRGLPRERIHRQQQDLANRLQSLTEINSKITETFQQFHNNDDDDNDPSVTSYNIELIRKTTAIATSAYDVIRDACELASSGRRGGDEGKRRRDLMRMVSEAGLSVALRTQDSSIRLLPGKMSRMILDGDKEQLEPDAIEQLARFLQENSRQRHSSSSTDTSSTTTDHTATSFKPSVTESSSPAPRLLDNGYDITRDAYVVPDHPEEEEDHMVALLRAENARLLRMLEEQDEKSPGKTEQDQSQATRRDLSETESHQEEQVREAAHAIPGSSQIEEALEDGKNKDKQLDEVQQKCLDLEDLIKHLKSKFQRTEEKFLQNQKESDDIRQLLEQSKEENAAIRKEMAKTEHDKTTLEQSLAKTSDECELLVRFLDKTKVEKRSLEDVLGRHEIASSSQLEDLQKQQQQIQSLTEENEKLRSEQLHMRDQLGKMSKNSDAETLLRLKQDKKRLLENFSRLEKENDTLLKTVQLITQENKIMSESHMKYNAEAKQQSDMLRESQQENEDKKNRLKEREHQFKDAMKKKGEKIATIKSQLDTCDKELKDALAKSEINNKEKIKSQEEVSALSHNIEKSKKQILDLSQQLEESWKASKEMEEEFNTRSVSREAELESLKEENVRLQEKKCRIQKERNEELALKQKQVDELCGSLEHHKQTNTILEDQLSIMAKNIEILEKNLLNNKKDVEEFEKKKKQLSERIVELESTEEECKKQIEDINEKLSEEKRKSESTLQMLKTEMENKDNVIQLLKSKLDEAEMRCDEDDTEKWRNIVQELRQQLETSQEENAIKTQKLDEKAEQIEELETNMENFVQEKEKECESLKVEIEEYKENMEKMIQEVTALKEKREEKIDELNSITREKEENIEELSETVSLYEKQTASIKSDLEKLEISINASNEEVEKKEQEVKEKNEIIEKLEQTEAELTVQVESLRRLLNDAEIENKENKKNKEDLIILEEKLQKTANENNNNKSMIEEMTREIEKWQNAAKLKDDELGERVKELGELRTNLKEVEKKEAAPPRDELKELEEKSKQVEDLLQRVQELEETEEALKYTMERADKILFEQEKSHEEELLEIREAMKRSTDFQDLNHSELQEEIEELDKKNASLESQVEKLGEKLKEIEAEKSESQERARELQSKLDETDEENQSLRSRASEAALGRARLQGSYDDLQKTVESLQGRMSELVEEERDVRRRLQQQEDKVEDLEEEKLKFMTLLNVGEGDVITGMGMMFNKPTESDSDESTGRRNKICRNNVTILDELQYGVDGGELPYGITIAQSEAASYVRPESQDNSTQTSEKKQQENLMEQITILHRENEELKIQLSLVTTRPAVEMKDQATGTDDDVAVTLIDDDTLDMFADVIFSPDEIISQKQIHGTPQQQQPTPPHVEGQTSLPRPATAGQQILKQQTKADQSPPPKPRITKQLYQDAYTIAEDIRKQLRSAETDNKELQTRLSDLKSECQSMLHVVEDQPETSQYNQQQRGRNGRMNEDTNMFKSAVRFWQAQGERVEQKPVPFRPIVSTNNTEEEFRNFHAKIAASNSQKYPSEAATSESEADSLDSSSSSSASEACPSPVDKSQPIPTSNAQPTTLTVQRVDSLAKNFEALCKEKPEGTGVSHGGNKPQVAEAPLKNGEITEYKMMIEKLQQQNQELQAGNISMTHQDKEAMEREISALRGQVALLQRNNKLFSDKERNEMKQDLDLATKRCNNYHSQLRALKESIDYEEIDSLRAKVDSMDDQIDQLKEELKEKETALEDAQREAEERKKLEEEEKKSESDEEEKGKKYARLLELEDEAEELQSKLEEKEVTLKNRDDVIEQLQEQLEDVQKKHTEEARSIERTNQDKLRKMEKDKKENEAEIAELKEAIRLKRVNLREKDDVILNREMEIERLERLAERKDRDFNNLKEEIAGLKRENDRLRLRIEKLKKSLASSIASEPTHSHYSSSIRLLPSSDSSSSSRSSSPLRAPQRPYSPPRRSDSFRSFSDVAIVSSGLASRGRSRRSSSQHYDSLPTDDVTNMLREDIADARQAVGEMGSLLTTPSRSRRHSPLTSQTNDPTSVSPIRSFSSRSPSPKWKSTKERRKVGGHSEKELASVGSSSEEHPASGGAKPLPATRKQYQPLPDSYGAIKRNSRDSKLNYERVQYKAPKMTDQLPKPSSFSPTRRTKASPGRSRRPLEHDGAARTRKILSSEGEEDAIKNRSKIPVKSPRGGKKWKSRNRGSSNDSSSSSSERNVRELKSKVSPRGGRRSRESKPADAAGKLERNQQVERASSGERHTGKTRNPKSPRNPKKTANSNAVESSSEGERVKGKSQKKTGISPKHRQPSTKSKTAKPSPKKDATPHGNARDSSASSSQSSESEEKQKVKSHKKAAGNQTKSPGISPKHKQQRIKDKTTKTSPTKVVSVPSEEDSKTSSSTSSGEDDHEVMSRKNIPKNKAKSEIHPKHKQQRLKDKTSKSPATKAVGPSDSSSSSDISEPEQVVKEKSKTKSDINPKPKQQSLKDKTSKTSAKKTAIEENDSSSTSQSSAEDLNERSQIKPQKVCTEPEIIPKHKHSNKKGKPTKTYTYKPDEYKDSSSSSDASEEEELKEKQKAKNKTKSEITPKRRQPSSKDKTAKVSPTKSVGPSESSSSSDSSEPEQEVKEKSKTKSEINPKHKHQSLKDKTSKALPKKGGGYTSSTTSSHNSEIDEEEVELKTKSPKIKATSELGPKHRQLSLQDKTPKTSPKKTGNDSEASSSTSQSTNEDQKERPHAKLTKIQAIAHTIPKVRRLKNKGKPTKSSTYKPVEYQDSSSPSDTSEDEELEEKQEAKNKTKSEISPKHKQKRLKDKTAKSPATKAVGPSESSSSSDSSEPEQEAKEKSKTKSEINPKHKHQGLKDKTSKTSPEKTAIEENDSSSTSQSSTEELNERSQIKPQKVCTEPEIIPKHKHSNNKGKPTKTSTYQPVEYKDSSPSSDTSEEEELKEKKKEKLNTEPKIIPKHKSSNSKSKPTKPSTYEPDECKDSSSPSDTSEEEELIEKQKATNKTESEISPKQKHPNSKDKTAKTSPNKADNSPSEENTSTVSSEEETEVQQRIAKKSSKDKKKLGIIPQEILKKIKAKGKTSDEEPAEEVPIKPTEQKIKQQNKEKPTTKEKQKRPTSKIPPSSDTSSSDVEAGDKAVTNTRKADDKRNKKEAGGSQKQQKKKAQSHPSKDDGGSTSSSSLAREETATKAKPEKKNKLSKERADRQPAGETPKVKQSGDGDDSMTSSDSDSSNAENINQLLSSLTEKIKNKLKRAKQHKVPAAAKMKNAENRKQQISKSDSGSDVSGSSLSPNELIREMRLQMADRSSSTESLSGSSESDRISAEGPKQKLQKSEFSGFAPPTEGKIPKVKKETSSDSDEGDERNSKVAENDKVTKQNPTAAAAGFPFIEFGDVGGGGDDDDVIISENVDAAYRPEQGETPQQQPSQISRNISKDSALESTLDPHDPQFNRFPPGNPVVTEATDVTQSTSGFHDHKPSFTSGDSLIDLSDSSKPRDSKQPDDAGSKAAFEEGSDLKDHVDAEDTTGKNPMSLNDLKELLDLKNALLPSLLPDDRPTLVHEVTVARAEARKWFDEVTKSDRDKREMGRKMLELESEVERLKTVEQDHSAKLLEKKNKLLNYDIQNLTDISEAANRQAEEMKERNALLKAHLQDLQDKGKKKPKKMGKQRGPEKPLTTEKGKTAKERELLSEETDKTLGDITDSFGYIANNFANLVLKKHQAETKLAPQQAKVSQLKRKCMERDQLLAKLLLKLKTKNKTASSNNNNSDDNNSVTSSTITTKLLVEGEKLINCDDDQSSETSADESVVKNDFLSPRRPNSALLRALNDSSTSVTKQRPQPTHRIYVAKRDYIPIKENKSFNVTTGSSDVTTSGLLPYIPLRAGDTVVGIGSPEKKENGKLYQLSEIRGKIGFVPFASLVAAEQVQGMQAFLEERKLKGAKETQSSGTDRIVNLYKSLEDASANIADKLSRSSATPSGVKHRARSHSLDRSSISPSHSASNVGGGRSHSTSQRRDDSRRGSGSGSGSRRRANSKQRHSDLFATASSCVDGSADDVIMTSTPIPAQRRRRSKAPAKPRRSTAGLAAEGLSRATSASSKSGRSRGASVPPSTTPQPPTCPIIEKVMGRGSLCLRWLPPRMDLMSRSNNVPVIGYEVSVNGVRFAQVAGAYTNQAIIGNLNLDIATTLHIRTVSSMGTVSEPVKIKLASSRGSSNNETDSRVSSVKSVKVRGRKATVLYDYNPQEDSPYTHQEQEVFLKQGQVVTVVSDQRHDGFCKVKAGSMDGWAPAAFLLINDDMTSSAVNTGETS